MIQLLQSLGHRRGLMLVCLSIAFAMLLGLFWDEESSDYAELSRHMLQLKTLDARLDRDVLQVTSFLLVQYDPLVQTTSKLNVVRQQLEQISDHSDNTLADRFTSFWDAMEQKLALLEKIKFRAALVRNGIHYLPSLAQGLRTQEPERYQQIIELINQLYIYQLLAADSHFDDVVSTLEQIKTWQFNSADSSELVKQLVFHINSNLHGLAKLDSLKRAYLAIPIQQHFEAVHDRHEGNRVAELSTKRQLIMLLSMSVITLIIGLWLLMRSLHIANRDANRSWSRLHDAVNNLSEAFALFDAKNQLVLHNRRFKDCYPWLSEHGMDHLSLDQLKSCTRTQVNNLDLEGQPIVEDVPLGQYVEQLDNGTWYLASNNRTSEGGLVCVRSDITESKRAEADSRKLSRVLTQSPASVVITNTEGIIEYVNPRFEKVSGYSSKEAVGRNSNFLKSGNLSSADYQAMWASLKAGNEWRGMFHNRHKDGSTYWESASISALRDEHDNITSFIAIKEDITARKLAEDQLKMNAAVFDTTAEGIMVTDAQNRIKTINPAFTQITGYTTDDVLGKTPNLLNSGRHEPAFYQKLWDSVLKHGHWKGEIWNKRKDGTIFPEWLSISVIRGKDDQVEEFVAVFTDVTQHKEHEEKIRYQANYDSLTGLPNRTLLFDRLGQAIATANHENHRLALLFVDLDNFKMVNDTFGHSIGDDLLKQVSSRLRSCLRLTDTVARFGGDEFVILMGDVNDLDGVAHVANHIIEKLTQVFTLHNREIYIGASIGITVYPDDTLNPDSLLQNADMAMYQAKQRSRNSYQFFTLSMQQRTLDRRQLELDLRQAIKRNELELHFQPVINPTLDRVFGVEALLRWNHSQRGQISPDNFIPIAEDSGQIGAIGEWVLINACRQLKTWNDAGFKDLKLAVNISNRQRELGFDANYLERVIEETGIQAQSLTLEITESLLMRDTEDAMTWLSSIKALGVSLAIDDFGTGYSSLSYLKRFPVDILKIDRSFISDLPNDAEDVTLVKTIVAMAQSLNLSLVAEGVETEQQVSFLVNCGCNNFQGYYYAKPMSATDLSNWLY